MIWKNIQTHTHNREEKDCYNIDWHKAHTNTHTQSYQWKKEMSNSNGIDDDNNNIERGSQIERVFLSLSLAEQLSNAWNQFGIYLSEVHFYFRWVRTHTHTLARAWLCSCSHHRVSVCAFCLGTFGNKPYAFISSSRKTAKQRRV